MQAFTFDAWTIWGLLAQGIFFSRFVIQWFQSEKQGRIVVPHVFWTLSLVGAVMILVYALARKDLVFLIASLLQLIIFSRSLVLSRRSHNVKIENFDEN